jgi:hypothetical protein
LVLLYSIWWRILEFQLSGATFLSTLPCLHPSLWCKYRLGACDVVKMKFWILELEEDRVGHYKKTRLLWLRPFDRAWLGNCTCPLLVILVYKIWLQSSGSHDFSHIGRYADGNTFKNMSNAFWKFDFSHIGQLDWR